MPTRVRLSKIQALTGSTNATAKQDLLSFDTEIKVARGSKSTLGDRINDISGKLKTDFEITNSYYESSLNRIVTVVAQGKALINNVLIEKTTTTSSYLYSPALNSTYYVYLTELQNVEIQASLSNSKSYFLLGKVTTGNSLSSVTHTDLRTLVQKNAQASETTILQVTSNTRPSNSNKGQHIFETDTNKTYRNIGTSVSPIWEEVGIKTDDVNTILIVTSSTRPTSSSKGQHIFETDTNKTYRNVGSSVSASWEEVGAGTQNTTSSVNQVTKLNVVGSVASPYTTEISITDNPQFNIQTPNVLKFIAGTQNVVTTIVNFNNSDASSFDSNSNVTFDGTMRLKTSYTTTMTANTTFTTGETLYVTTLDLSSFKKIEKIEVI